MDWKTIEETYKHFNKDWAHYPQEYCIEDQLPSYKVRFQNVQECKEDDGWVNSTHPFCKSCYSLYSQVCENVGTFFNIGKNWKKENLDNEVNLFIETYLDKPLDKSIEMYESALQSFIDCINAIERTLAEPRALARYGSLFLSPCKEGLKGNYVPFHESC